MNKEITFSTITYNIALMAQINLGGDKSENPVVFTIIFKVGYTLYK